MTQIFEFPERAVRNWNSMERALREQMNATGWAKEKIDIYCARIKIHHLELSKLSEFRLSINLPIGLSEEQEQQIRDAIREVEEGGRACASSIMTYSLTAIGKLEKELFEISP
ncbi:hypothetical protein [Candidatus Deferrimicrobium sp.]|uniref:hypothetical protein n=1 Tax=Candidatus Deferrimicrobium sp. TaxID=3060586 RepID=UPI002718ADDB|nr:hypothetical protein [Candidatus Deferrimicrobium sp.]MDO8739422.1 hypothetical protein [Candidatus Deferrimicrobium sp.]